MKLSRFRHFQKTQPKQGGISCTSTSQSWQRAMKHPCSNGSMGAIVRTMSKLKDSGSNFGSVVGASERYSLFHGFPIPGESPEKGSPAKRSSTLVACACKVTRSRQHLFDSAPFVVLANLGQRCESVGELQDSD